MWLRLWQEKINLFDFERKDRHFPGPKMDTFSQTSNCLQVYAGETYALIFDTEPFQKAYRGSRNGFFFKWNSVFVRVPAFHFWTFLIITFCTLLRFCKGRNLRSLLKWTNMSEYLKNHSFDKKIIKWEEVHKIWKLIKSVNLRAYLALLFW